MKKPVSLLVPSGLFSEEALEGDINAKLNVISTRPQATFQIELAVVPEFITSLIKDGVVKDYVLSRAKKEALDKKFAGEMERLTRDREDIELTSMFDTPKKKQQEESSEIVSEDSGMFRARRLKDIKGFYYLSKFYLISLLGKRKLEEKEDKITYLEGGVKGMLPVMSRLSFSDMYKKNKLQGNVLKVLAQDEKLFEALGDKFPRYVVSKVPYNKIKCEVPPCFGNKCGDAKINGCGKTKNFRKYIIPDEVLAMLQREGIFNKDLAFDTFFTPENWLKSIEKPFTTSLTPRPDREAISLFSSHLSLHQYSEKFIGDKATLGQARRAALRFENFTKELFSKNDLLYPVPFLSTEDSMGSFQWKDDFFGHAILEVRRYATFFGETELYKEGEANGAFSKLPDFLSKEAKRVRDLK